MAKRVTNFEPEPHRGAVVEISGLFHIIPEIETICLSIDEMEDELKKKYGPFSDNDED